MVMLLKHSAQYLAHSNYSINGLRFRYTVVDPGFAEKIWEISLGKEIQTYKYKIWCMQMRDPKLDLSSAPW